MKVSCFPQSVKSHFSTNRMSKMQFPERFITGILRSGRSSCYNKSWGSWEQNMCHRMLKLERKIARAGWFCVSKGSFVEKRNVKCWSLLQEGGFHKKLFEDVITAWDHDNGIVQTSHDGWGRPQSALLFLSAFLG